MPAPNKKNHKDIIRFLTELEAFTSVKCYDGEELIYNPAEIFKFPIPIYTGKIDTNVSLPTLLKLYNERSRVIDGDCDAKRNIDRKATSQAIIRKAISLEWKYVRNVSYENLLTQILPEEYQPAIVQELDTSNWELNNYYVPVEMGFKDELVIYY